jgi:hypothetical protein
LLPQDLKLEIETLSREEAVGGAELFLARAAGMRGKWRGENAANGWPNCAGNRNKSLDAPSWLWNSVVDLAAAHEAAYSTTAAATRSLIIPDLLPLG